ncbi:MAG: hypothetical protein ACYTDT_13610 [Planctomycetota bacterium]|jgi:hypothetical protein
MLEYVFPVHPARHLTVRIVSLLAILFSLIVVSGCTSTPDINSSDSDRDGLFNGNSGFGDGNSGNAGKTTSSGEYESTDVQRFRGIKMPDLLARMDSADSTDWKVVRKFVHPKVKAPKSWPPRNPAKMSSSQKKYYNYVKWPTHIRELLQSKNWDSAETRTRLTNYGRMYYIVYRFQTRKKAGNEAPIWREFAESMLVYGDDGQEMLVNNLIVSLSSPNDSVILNAQDILIQVGPPALEPLCAALWTRHNQLVEYTDARGNLATKVVSNPDFNKHVADTIYFIGPRAVTQCIYELETMVDKRGKSGGTTWRFRKYFVELLGRFRDQRGLKALEAEITRVVVEEPDADEWAKNGRFVKDKRASDNAEFVFHEHLINAIGNIRDPEGLRPIIRLWSKDEFHEPAALEAILKITDKMVRSIEGARRLAKELKVDLKGA